MINSVTLNKLSLSDFCTPGYYSENGLEECMRCPNNTYTLEYRAKNCFNCTQEDVGVIPVCRKLTHGKIFEQFNFNCILFLTAEALPGTPPQVSCRIQQNQLYCTC